MKRNDLIDQDTFSLSRLILEKKISPVELVKAQLSRIEKENPDINAIVALSAENALQSARTAEKQLMKQQIAGPLHGIPFLVKDLFDTADIRTTYGSVYFKDHVPVRDAFIVEKLKSAGGILLGKTNTSEFGFSHLPGNKLYGATKNPWNPACTPGGSSGGNGAALSARMSTLSIGSDLGGSVRVPAHCCGITGFRPSLGKVSTEGHSRAGTPVNGALLAPGIMTRTVRDISLILPIIEGFNHRDPFMMGFAHLKTQMDNAPSKGYKCALIDFRAEIEIDEEIDGMALSVASLLSRNDGAWERKRIPMSKELSPTLRTLVGTDLKYSVNRYLADHRVANPDLSFIQHIPDGFTTRDYMQAYGKMLGIRVMINSFFQKFDLLILPVLPTTAPPVRSPEGRDLSADKLFDLAVPNFLAVLAGSPCLALPVGIHSNGMPIGLQIVGAYGKDAVVLQAGEMIENEMKFFDSTRTKSE